MNIEILRAFSMMKQTILTNKDILMKLELIDQRIESTEVDIQELFKVIQLLIQAPEKPRERIGFKPDY